jgi:hypothetical protein
VTPLYPQKLALTSPTSGGRLVGVVRSRTKATELLVITTFAFIDFNPDISAVWGMDKLDERQEKRK